MNENKGSFSNPYSYLEYQSYKLAGVKNIGFVDFGEEGIWMVGEGLKYPGCEGTGTGTGTGTNPWPEEEQIGTGTGSGDDSESDNHIPENYYIGKSNVVGNININGIEWDASGVLTYVMRVDGRMAVSDSIYGTVKFTPRNTIEDDANHTLRGEEFENFYILKDHDVPAEYRVRNVAFPFTSFIDCDGEELDVTRRTEWQGIYIPVNAVVGVMDNRTKTIELGDTTLNFDV